MYGDGTDRDRLLAIMSRVWPLFCIFWKWEKWLWHCLLLFRIAGVILWIKRREKNLRKKKTKMQKFLSSIKWKWWVINSSDFRWMFRFVGVDVVKNRWSGASICSWITFKIKINYFKNLSIRVQRCATHLNFFSVDRKIQRCFVVHLTEVDDAFGKWEIQEHWNWCAQTLSANGDENQFVACASFRIFSARNCIKSVLFGNFGWITGITVYEELCSA